MKEKKICKIAILSLVCPLTLLLTSQAAAAESQNENTSNYLSKVKADESRSLEVENASNSSSPMSIYEEKATNQSSAFVEQTNSENESTNKSEPLPTNHVNLEQPIRSENADEASSHGIKEYEIEFDQKTKYVNDELIAMLAKKEEKGKQSLNDSKVNIQVPEQFSYYLNKLVGVKNIKEIANTNLEKSEKEALTKLIDSYIKSTNDQKFDGRGIVIASVDSGADVNSQDMTIDQDPNVKKHLKLAANKDLGFTEKIPFGFNYLTGTYDIKDRSNRPHGMHIAGILAGNSKIPGGFKGIAPNAQILSYRVFSTEPKDEDNPSYVGPDSKFHAIDDAIRRKADIISLSIGERASGLSDDDFYAAVKKATDEGIIVVAAMGNYAGSASTNSYDTYVDNEYRLKDTSTAVGVAATESAIGVGSINNMVVQLPRVLIDGKEYPFTEVGAHSIKRLPKNKEDFGIIYLGKGTPEDIAKYNPNNDSYKDKVVLIQRGDESLKMKVERFLKNSKGVILVNEIVSSTRGNYHRAPVMGYDDLDLKQNWVISLSHDDGKELIDKVQKLGNKKVNLQFKTELKPYIIADQNGVSGFSSWGPNFGLEMKPDLLGQGEYIYSTRNDDDYFISSGTSMASPHVAASAALLLPKVKEWINQNPELKSRFQLTNSDIMKILLMNTATPLINHQASELGKEIEHSPRQQGAGFINVNKAFNSEVLIRSKRSGGASLGEIGKDHSFTLTLHNMSNQSQTFDIEMGDIFTTSVKEVTRDDEYGPVKIKAVIPNILSDVKLSGPKQLTLAAKGSMEITFNLQSSELINDFIEGYLYFKSHDGKHPHLSVPFMGFMGDWNSEAVLDKPAWDKDANTHLVELVKEKYLEHDKNDYEPLIKHESDEAVNPKDYAMTTNLNRKVGPRLIFLRDASDYDVAIVKGEQKEQLVRVLKVGHYPFKYMESTYRESADLKAKLENIDSDILWDGKIHDENSFGELKKADPGQYYFRIRAKAGKSDEFETIYLPILIDNEKPDFDLKYKKQTLQISATDNHKVESVKVSLEKGYRYEALNVTKDQNDSYVVEIPKKEGGQVTLRIVATDIAGNACEKTVVLDQNGKLTVKEETLSNYNYQPKKSDDDYDEAENDLHSLARHELEDRADSDDDDDDWSDDEEDDEDSDIDAHNIVLTHGKEITLHTLASLQENHITYDDNSKIATLDYAIYLKKGYQARVRNINTQYNSLQNNLSDPYKAMYDTTLKYENDSYNKESQEYNTKKVPDKLKLANGNNLVYVDILDEKGSTVFHKNYFIFVDLETPTLELLNKEVFKDDEDLTPVLDTSNDSDDLDDFEDDNESDTSQLGYYKGIIKTNTNQLTMKFSVKDNLDFWKLYVNNDMIDSFSLDGYYQKNQKFVSYTMPVKDKQKICVRLEDRYGNSVEDHYVVVIDPTYQDKKDVIQASTLVTAKSYWNQTSTLPVKVKQGILERGKEYSINDLIEVGEGTSYSIKEPLSTQQEGIQKLSIELFKGNTRQFQILTFTITDPQSDNIQKKEIKDLPLTEDESQKQVDDLNSQEVIQVQDGLNIINPIPLKIKETQKHQQKVQGNRGHTLPETGSRDDCSKLGALFSVVMSLAIFLKNPIKGKKF